MKLAKTGGEFKLRRRADKSVSKIVDANDLWNKISYNAWAIADPGIQFHMPYFMCPAKSRALVDGVCEPL